MDQSGDIRLASAPSTYGPFDPDAVGVLGACLALGPAGDAAALRADIARVGAERLFALTDTLRLTPALASALQDKALFVDMPPITLPDGRRTIARTIADELAAHDERRAALTARLTEIVAACNRIGIEPLLIKGARSLWIGGSRWRAMLDLDLLAASPRAEAIQSQLRAIGYVDPSNLHERPAHHHLTPLARRDSPGTIEVHKRGGNRQAEPLITTAELEAAATVWRHDSGARARILPAPLHLLHSLVHHHVGHSSGARGLVDLKGLYEFAAEIARLDEQDRDALLARARRHPRLLVALDLWIAAANAFFALPVGPPLLVCADAAERWRRALARLTGMRRKEWKYPGYAEDLAMATDRDRAKRAGGDSPVARVTLGWRAAISLAPKIA
ncbi:MAG: hypothetical protein E7774_00070 [Bradyrhizobium sp.]|nr:MAG: hypothetical protein E7774_00070 [Bradyrhizobium sp.]